MSAHALLLLVVLPPHGHRHQTDTRSRFITVPDTHASGGAAANKLQGDRGLARPGLCLVRLRVRALRAGCLCVQLLVCRRAHDPQARWKEHARLCLRCVAT